MGNESVQRSAHGTGRDGSTPQEKGALTLGAGTPPTGKIGDGGSRRDNRLPSVAACVSPLLTGEKVRLVGEQAAELAFWIRVPGTSTVSHGTSTQWGRGTKRNDTVVALGYLGGARDKEEQVELLRRLSKGVRPGGRLIVCEEAVRPVPGVVGRVRPFTHEDLAERLKDADLEVEGCYFGDLLGAGFIRANARFGGGDANLRTRRLYSGVLMPVSRVLNWLHLPYGQDIIAVARVPES